MCRYKRGGRGGEKIALVKSQRREGPNPYSPRPPNRTSMELGRVGIPRHSRPSVIPPANAGIHPHPPAPYSPRPPNRTSAELGRVGISCHSRPIRHSCERRNPPTPAGAIQPASAKPNINGTRPCWHFSSFPPPPSFLRTQESTHSRRGHTARVSQTEHQPNLRPHPPAPYSPRQPNRTSAELGRVGISRHSRPIRHSCERRNPPTPAGAIQPASAKPNINGTRPCWHFSSFPPHPSFLRTQESTHSRRGHTAPRQPNRTSTQPPQPLQLRLQLTRPAPQPPAAHPAPRPDPPATHPSQRPRTRNSPYPSSPTRQ